MGIIRKTASVGTLGIISFRSKKERLRRSEKARASAEEALDTEHRARLVAEARGTVADKKVRRATVAAEKAARKLESARQKSGRSRKAKKLAALMATAEPLVRSGFESARSASHEAADRGRTRGRKARKSAKKAAKVMRKDAARLRKDAGQSAEHAYQDIKAAARSAKDTVAPELEKAVHRASEKIDQLTSR